MKTKRNKKSWDFTNKNLRRDYSDWRGKVRWNKAIPKWYLRKLHKQNKFEEKLYIRDVKLGNDLDYLELKLINQLSSAGYTWY